MTVPVGAAGVRGLGGRGYLAYSTGVGAVGRGGSGGASYLKVDKQAEEKLYELLPGMELTPMSTAAMNLKAAAAIKPAPQVRERRFSAPSVFALEKTDPRGFKTYCSCGRKPV